MGFPGEGHDERRCAAMRGGRACPRAHQSRSLPTWAAVLDGGARGVASGPLQLWYSPPARAPVIRAARGPTPAPRRQTSVRLPCDARSVVTMLLLNDVWAPAQRLARSCTPRRDQE